MANNAVDLFFQHLRIILDPERRSTDTDGQLLARWVSARDGRAFAALVARHGALVWRASRGVLHLREDTEDVFQATFLMLARKAAGLQKHSSITGWLYQTASRLALKARTAKLRRLRHEEQAGPKMAVDPLEEISVREARTILGEELERLSAVHREAILLCLYEGATQDEAAKRLGCSLNTLKRRLERGRALLGQRLTKRGLAPENAFALTLCADIKIPVQLVHQTITLASKFAAGEALTGTAALLAEGALRTIMVKKLVVGFAVILGGLTMVAGTLRVPSAEPGANGIKAVALNAGHGTRSVPATKAAPPENDEPDPRLDANGHPLPPGAVQRIGSNSFRHGGLFTGVLYMPDGKAMASSSSDGYLNFWDAANGKLRWRFKGEVGNKVLAVSGDGKKLAALSALEYALVESDTGKLLARHEWPKGNKDETAGALAIAPDMGTFARACGDATVRLYDAVTGQENVRITMGQNAQLPFPLALEFSGDGKTIYVLAAQNPRFNLPSQTPRVMVFDTKAGKAVQTLEIPKDMARPYRLVLSPNGQMLAALERGTALDRVVLWDLTTGKQLHLIEKQLSALGCGAFSPENRLVAVGGQSADIVLFDTVTGKELRRLHSHPSTMSLVFAPDGKTLVSTDSSGGITLWDVATGKPTPPSPEPNGLGRIGFANNSKEILSFGDSIDSWDVTSAKLIRHVALDPKWLFVSAVSPDGHLLVANLAKGDLALIDGATGEHLRNLTGHKSPYCNTAFSPDGTKLFSAGGFDPHVIIWDVATGKPLHELKSHTVFVQGLAVSPDGRWLASAARDAAAKGDYDIRLWEVASGKLVHRLTPRRGSAFAMVFSADSSQLVSVGGEPGQGNSSGEVQLWQVVTGKELRSFTGHQDSVNCVAISPDGRMLATASLDKTLRLWEVATGTERGRISGHEAQVTSIDFSPDGRLLAAASNDAPIYLWNPYALEKPKTPRTKLAKEDREKLWQKLADADAAAAFKAICELIARPKEAVGLLRDAWKGMPRATVKQMRQWLEELNSEQFVVRKNATEELERFAVDHEDVLREALQKPASLEARQRLERILARIEPERLRRGRMLEVLEQVRTAEARQFLQSLAEQKEDASLARDATAGLKRLAGE